MVTIENEFLRVSAKTMGAELTSVFDKKRNRELLWQGDPAVWPDHGPLLFPLVARLKNETYTLDGREYRIDIHGFGRNKEFAPRQESETAMAFSLTDDPETRGVYPFAFSLTVRYTLDGRRLVKEHRVENRSGERMYYEIGGHEGYNLALNPGETMAQYALSFGGRDVVYTHTTDEDILFNKGTVPVPLRDGKLYLDMKTFERDALVLDDRAGKTVTLLDAAGAPVLTVDFSDFAYLGIWTKYLPTDTNYVCLEPWSSLPDGNYLGTELSEKEKVRRLEAGQSETLFYAVTVA